ncbi:MAG: calcium/sodium antiporter [Polaribacter sp.]|jgi:cation:H+ antiporter|nr:calcium/sodium antiporter [Polaribacter sp.]
MSIPFLIFGFVLLVIGGDFLVRASVALSLKLNFSKLVIGMTVVSFATSAPELLVSLNAALSGAPAIAINNVVGSNIANIGLVLGITAIIGSIGIDASFYRIHWPVMMLFSGMLYYFLWNDHQLSAIEGGVLFIALIAFVAYLIRGQKRTTDATEDIEEVDDALAVVPGSKIGIWLFIGATALYFGSEWLVKGATEIALILGVSEAVIGVTMIAIGTSVPELAASVIAAVKKEKAISLGNLIGSNIFNIGSVLGVTSIIKTIPVTEPLILSRDIFWMLLFAVSILVLALLPKRNQINQIKGLVLVVLYGVFIFIAFRGA